jgi:prepilin-type processing-associated H-X9-DG protein
LEQSPLYDKFDTKVPAVNEAGPVGQANVQLTSTPLEVFVCPSAVGGLGRVYNGKLPAGAGGLPLPTLTWRSAPSDYGISTGVRGAFSNLAYAGFPGGGGGSRHGSIVNHITINGTAPSGVNNLTGSLASVLDGTTHTFLLSERTGGNVIFSKRVPWVAPAALLTVLGEVNGGGWGDALNGEHWLAGTLHGGPQNSPPGPPTIPEGPCAINCTNANGRGFHSFHPGGCQFVMVDGSVQFVSETAAALAVAARITREKGEVVPN